MSYEHPKREKARQQQKRKNQLTALLAGLGVGLAFALPFLLLVGNWLYALGLGVFVAIGAVFGLNAVRKDSREIADDMPESR